jgi:cyanate lyase
MVRGDVLKAKIQGCGMTCKDVAMGIGIDESTFYRKLTRGKKSFSVEEVKRMKDMLHLTANETAHIFFA